MTNFIYPNEGAIDWGLMIVIYPYITGLVAGAFIVSSLYHVFGIKALKPVARFSLITALAFLLITPLPLTVHLGRPERAFEMLLRPNFTSAMAGFGFIWFTYLIILLAEIWLVFRKDIVNYYLASKGGMKKTLYSILALGVYDISEKSLALDKKITKILAMIGIPVACLLHGYVGFIFGAIKANAWWATPLMPIIFLTSAIVSGIALLIVLYVIVSKIRKTPLDHECLHNLALWLGGFLTVALVLESLEVFAMFYESEESWAAISELISSKIAITYLGIQLTLGTLIPMFILGSLEMFGKVRERTKMILRFGAAFLILIGIFSMRWNVIIGGQLMSKGLRGFATYNPPLFGIEGVLLPIAIFILPFIILAVIAYIIPPWEDKVEHVEVGLRHSFGSAETFKAI